jgi:hypothetical protein
MTKSVSEKPHSHNSKAAADLDVITKSAPTPNSQRSTRVTGREDIMRRRRNRRVKPRPPPKVPGAEIFSALQKSLSEFEQNAIRGRFDGRPDLVMEAFMDINDLRRQAYEVHFELHRETCENVHYLHVRVHAFWDDLWKHNRKKVTT